MKKRTVIAGLFTLGFGTAAAATWDESDNHEPLPLDTLFTICALGSFVAGGISAGNSKKAQPPTTEPN